MAKMKQNKNFGEAGVFLAEIVKYKKTHGIAEESVCLLYR